HEVTFSQEGGTVSVAAKDKKQRNWSLRNRENLEVRFVIVIPAKFDVDLNTAGGDIVLGDLEGNAAARTSACSIKLSRVSGQVQAANSGGDIVVHEAGADVVLRTSSGLIDLQKSK